ncbi:MAG: hypothetical protein V2A79_15090, partial [Planctomycetota bacterium]
TVFDDGTGPALYAGGYFTWAGDVPANSIAKWNGTQWSALGSGMNRYVHALTVFDDGTGPALYAGGSFTTAGGLASSYIASWGCQSPTDHDGDGIPNESDNCPEHYNPSQADCDGDGIGDACQPGATDCNGNDIPDECDLAAGTSQDCNTNSIPDECDIAGGTSEDCDTNGTPDECELCGDLDNDGDVDGPGVGTDYAIFLAAYGHAVGDPLYNPCADYNHSGMVGQPDYQTWRQCYYDANGKVFVIPKPKPPKPGPTGPEQPPQEQPQEGGIPLVE